MNAIFSSKPFVISAHIFCWLLFFLIPLGFAGDLNVDTSRVLLHSLQRTVMFAILFYINYLWMIDAFLNKRKVVVFVLVNLALIVFFLYARELHILGLDAPPPNAGDKQPKRPPKDNFIYYIDFLTYLIPIAVAIALHLFQMVSKMRIKQAKEEKKLVQQELQYLRYQVQPHFFFNSLNNIYSLIDLDTEQAKEAVHSLSKLMRYMLYRTENEKVALQEEVDFVRQYIELMKLRMRKNVSITVDFPEQIPAMKIAPLLFISVVENAFKHGVSATESSELLFQLRIEGNRVTFYNENTNFPKSEKDESGSGIGIENLRKRLKLLYPDASSYRFEVLDNTFRSELWVEIQ